MPCKSHPPPSTDQSTVAVRDEVRRWEFTWQYGIMATRLRHFIWGGGSQAGLVGEGLLERIRRINEGLSKVMGVPTMPAVIQEGGDGPRNHRADEAGDYPQRRASWSYSGASILLGRAIN